MSEPSPPTPADIEADALRRLEADYARLLTQLSAVPEHMTASEAQGTIQWLSEWVDWLRPYGADAEYCAAAGYPALRARLGSILADLDGAIRIYAEKLQDLASENERKMQQLGIDVARQNAAIFTETMARAQNARDEINRQWQQVLRNEYP
jgi:hypothetical protein